MLGESDCELIGSGTLAQPVNAVTSLAFVAAGLLVARVAVRRGDRRRSSLLFAGLLASVGLGSVAFHGPQPGAARVLHDLPIVAIAVFVVAAVVHDVAEGRWMRRTDLTVTVLLVAAAGTAWVLGRTGSPTCDPGSALQLHGVWHVLAAIALGQWWLASADRGTPTAYAGDQHD